jgi:hypothetical protein
MLLCGSGDELCDPLLALLPGVAHRPPPQSSLPFHCLFTDSSWILAPCPSSFLQCTFAALSTVKLQFALCYSVLLGAGGFPWSWPPLPAGCAVGCTGAGAIKGWLVGQSEFFPVPSVMAVIILARSSQNYPRVSPVSQGGFGVMEVRLSASVPLCQSWIQCCIFLLNIYSSLFCR